MFNPDKPDETPQKTYRFASLLRADGGAKEIETAIDLALQLNLKGNELKQAIRAAE
jgi:hypothetical protein